MLLAQKRLGLAVVVYAAVVACSNPEILVNSPDTPPPPLPPSSLSVSVTYATLLGGPGFEEGREPVVFPDGRLLFGVRTYSSNMPASPGAVQSTLGGGSDTFLAVLSTDGTSLLAGTYLGGSGDERPPYGMELTSNGDIVVTSGTKSSNFPVTPGAYRSAAGDPNAEGYVCRLSPDLRTRRWCTYAGGEPRGGLALTPNDEPIIVGRATGSASFAPSAGVFQGSLRGVDDVFISKLNAAGSAQVWGTYLGGTGSEVGEVALSVNVIGSEVLVGGIAQSADFPTTADALQRTGAGRRDAFLSRLSGDGVQLRYSTLLGGSGEDESGHRDHVLPDGSVVVGGGFGSSSVPGFTGTGQGGSAGWVGKMTPSNSFQFLRFVGGSGQDRIIDRAADAAGRIYAIGTTTSDDFPVTAGALQTQRAGGQDGFLLIMDGTGNILYSTYLGGSGFDIIRGIEIGADGAVYLVGGTESSDFPTTSGSFQSNRSGDHDGFAMKLKISP